MRDLYLERATWLQEAIDGELTGAQVAAKLNLSVRHIRRWRRRWRTGGVASSPSPRAGTRLRPNVTTRRFSAPLRENLVFHVFRG